MEKNKSVKRMDWRQKVLISILGSFIVILSILFYITYHYFVAKIETGNEKVVLMTFEQAEKNLKNVLKNAELCLDKYVTNDLIYCVVNNTYEPQDTTVYIGDGGSFELHMEPNEIKWYQIQ